MNAKQIEKPLARGGTRTLYYMVGDKRQLGPHEDLYGDRFRHGLWGDCSNLRGNFTNLRGDCSDLWGNLDDIPLEARKEHPDVADWVA